MIARRYIIFLLWICLKGFSQGATDIKILDPKFLQYIRMFYPEVLEYGGDKVIASKAALITGCMDASGYGVSNLEGIQCFSNLTKLDVHNNKLSTLPSLNTLTALQSLNVAQNNLMQLPSLDKLSNLTELIAYGNQLQSLPNLSNNVLLDQLIVNNNQLSQLPALNAPLLKDLVVDNNLLSQLPDLSNCKLLVKLSCAGNVLSQAPSLDSLKALQILDLSYNKLGQIPNLSFNVALEQAYFNDNKISKIYTFPYLASLQKVKLYDNALTFASLTKILPFPNHKNIFELSPQADTFVTQYINTVRTEDVNIVTGIDGYAGNVYYRWYKNGAFYKNCTYDHFALARVNYADSGTYYCEIKHDSFPEITFRSDRYDIKIRNCVNTSALAFTISSVDCENSGRLSVRSEESSNFRYLLGRNAQYTADTSKTGEFKSLLDGSYSLQIITEKGCTVDYPKDILIPKEECTYPLLTPNDDGDRDTYYFEESGEVIIYDKQGNLIKTLQTPGFWDATSKNGKVRAGLYVADLNKGQKITKISVVY